MPSRCALALVLTTAALAAIVAPAAAVLSGENGRIVLASGRDAGDAQAQLFLLPVPGSTGGGTISPAITSGTEQHRHPTWSPDRTKIAYARGVPPNFDIFILDLTTPGATPVNITNSPLVTDDRPAWSLDGTKIAWESEVTDGSGQRDVLYKDAPFTGLATNFTNTTTAGQFEGRPAWSPSSAVLYYEKNDPGTQDADIVRKPLAAGVETLAVANSSIDEYQPSISPDGTKVCFTLSNNTFNGTADVLVAPLTSPPSGGTVVSFDIVTDDYNCTWSPDGQFIAYVNGTTINGELVMVRSDDSSLSPISLAQDPGANNFDGNPDWAPDGRPDCPDSTVSTPVNTPVTISMDCVDTGPAYERTPVRESVANGGDPTNGTAGQVTLGDPSTVVYTPNAGFTGTDSLQFIGFDDLGFGTDRGTVTINVTQIPPPATCGGRDATIVGTAGDDTLNGTGGVDVIAGLGGNDTVRGAGGNDIICGGSGNDRVGGGSGNDRVNGESGNDSVSGNSGNDRLTGASGNDRMSGGTGRDRLTGNSGRDRLLGGGGRDRLNAGSGRDRLDGGASRDICTGGPSRDTARRCEQSFSL